MGNCCSKTHADSEINAELENKIDEQLRKDANAKGGMPRLLMLGCGESGKSTIYKQLVGNLYTIQDSDSIYSMMSIALDAVNQLVIYCTETLPPDVMESAAALSTVASNQSFEYDELIGRTMVQHLPVVWNDPSIQRTWMKIRYTSSYIVDSSKYALSNFDRIALCGLSPEDVVRVRYRTTGILTNEATIAGRTVGLTDTGGERSERLKWPRVFDRHNAIVFVVDIAGFNRILFEDATHKRLMEAYQVFTELCMLKEIEKYPMILLLNKKDLFKEKIDNGEDLSQSFTDYLGGEDVDKAIEFIKNKFEAAAKRPVMTYVISALDRQEVQDVFKDILSKLPTLPDALHDD